MNPLIQDTNLALHLQSFKGSTKENGVCFVVPSTIGPLGDLHNTDITSLVYYVKPTNHSLPITPGDPIGCSLVSPYGYKPWCSNDPNLLEKGPKTPCFWQREGYVIWLDRQASNLQLHLCARVTAEWVYQFPYYPITLLILVYYIGAIQEWQGSFLRPACFTGVFRAVSAPEASLGSHVFTTAAVLAREHSLCKP